MDGSQLVARPVLQRAPLALLAAVTVFLSVLAGMVALPTTALAATKPVAAKAAAKPATKPVATAKVTTPATAKATATKKAMTSASGVTADAQGLLLNGKRWWPAGVNAYQLATNWSINAGCGAQVDLASFFASRPANSLIRFDAFQALAINKKTGKLDTTAIDAVFAAAEKANQRVLPVLSGQWGDCEDGRYKQYSWYQKGWTQNNGPAAVSIMSFQSWVSIAVNRWKGSSALAGWELVGEPEAMACTDTACTSGPRSCPADASTVLRTWMDTAGDQVRAIDPNHLIFAGFIGGGQCGTAGAQYATVSASPGIDVLEYHDFGADGVALPGDQWNGLAERIRQAKSVSKPLFVAEVGESAGSCKSLAARATSVQRKVEGQKAAGTAGILVWSWVPDPRPSQCTYDVGPNDPLLGTLARFNTLG